LMYLVHAAVGGALVVVGFIFSGIPPPALGGGVGHLGLFGGGGGAGGGR
jgi:hypothetical protein